AVRSLNHAVALTAGGAERGVSARARRRGGTARAASRGGRAHRSGAILDFLDGSAAPRDHRSSHEPWLRAGGGRHALVSPVEPVSGFVALNFPQGVLQR